MTACLRCDGCSKASAEHEADLRQWWRLTRHGVEWAEEASLPKYNSPATSFSMNSVFMGVGSLDDDDVEDALVVAGDMVLDDDEPSIAILHFCSARCLGNWASQASALEPDQENIAE